MELLKRNYRVLAKEYHPDRPHGNENKFKELQSAYEFLLNDINRKEYCVSKNRKSFGKRF